MSFKTENMCFHNVLYDQNGQQIEIDVSSRQIDHCKLFTLYINFNPDTTN